jgi:predicted alpha/beta superfamily hydrolase
MCKVIIKKTKDKKAGLIKMTPQDITFIIDKTPEDTPSGDRIYISGQFCDWLPDVVFYEAEKQPDGKHAVTLRYFKNDHFEYKFTRGSWNNAETTAKGGHLQNRVFDFQGETVIHIEIEGWEDMQHTYSKNVSILSNKFVIPQLNKTRRIWIYIPPDYHVTTTKYPVLYMHDGQDLFDRFTAFDLEWKVDKILDKYFYSGFSGIIVVGIDNDKNNRRNEYLPPIHADCKTNESELYAQFIVETLKPYIDSHFRTYRSRNYTGMIGAIEAGLLSFYMGVKYQKTFSKIGIFSPSFEIDDLMISFLEKHPKKYSVKYYFLTGLKDNVKNMKNLQELARMLHISGYQNNEIKISAKIEGETRSWFWKKEFPEAFRWLFVRK